MIKQVAENSKREHFPRSRLIPFTNDEINFIRGTSDFFGLNHYTTSLAKIGKTNYVIPSFENDINVYTYNDPSWPDSAAPWLNVVPWGLRKLLNWIKNEYDNPIVYITENGYADHGQLNDSKRINYHKVRTNCIYFMISY